MKYLNIHLLSVVSVIVVLFTFNWQYGNETFVFFGFAENKEMEIRVEHPVTIEQIHVTAGSKVNKGDLLLEVTRSGMELAESDLNHEIARLNSQLNIWEANLRASIRLLKAQRTAKENEIQTQIEQLESEISINRSLIKDLESITPATDRAGTSPNEIKIRGLKKELKLAIKPLDSEIKKLRDELYASQNPLKIQTEKLKEELGFNHEEEEKLTIVAPNDGIVGSVFCKGGEQFSGFNTLLTFYEENPTHVKGFVLESLILKVNMGDEIIVNSGVNSAVSCNGKVIGMGSRIVEIPERLRKIPTFKTYGREILIEIPSANGFLQKEKVVLKLPPEKNGINDKFIKIFTPPNPSSASILHEDNIEKE
jgi:multidrug resistance efflux pump